MTLSGVMNGIKKRMAGGMNNLYEALGVQADANQDEIKKVYRKLATQYHPDKGGDPEQFKKITEAYSILSDNNKRRQYDNQRMGQSHSGFRGFTDIFESFFNQNRSNPAPRPQSTEDRDINFKVGVTLEQIKQGASQRINYNRNKLCNSCNGKGGDERRICEVCKGVGTETVSNGRFIQQFPCRTCTGRGVVFVRICSSCHGNGVHQVTESVIIEIKQG